MLILAAVITDTCGSSAVHIRYAYKIGQPARTAPQKPPGYPPGAFGAGEKRFDRLGGGTYNGVRRTFIEQGELC